jgi:hypothetical protein
MQLFDGDDDKDCATVGNAAGECNQEAPWAQHIVHFT